MTTRLKTVDPKKINAHLEKFPTGEFANLCGLKQIKPVIFCSEVLMGMTVIFEIAENI